MSDTQRSLWTSMSHMSSFVRQRVLPFLLGAIVSLGIVTWATTSSKQMTSLAYGSATPLSTTPSQCENIPAVAMDCAGDWASASEAFDVPPEPIHRVMPTYPDSTEGCGAEDMFLVAVLVDTTGTVVRAKLEESHPLLLEKLVLEAASQWRFTPAKKRSELVMVWYAMPLVFEARAE